MISNYLLVDIQFTKMPVLRTLWLIVVNAIYQNAGATHLMMGGGERFIILIVSKPRSGDILVDMNEFKLFVC